MKLHSDTTTHGTLTGQTTAMGFDAEATPHLMMMLSKNYGASAEAVLREYANNARDSHIAAGTDAPIEVSLPSLSGDVLSDDYRQELTVVDHGVGMSREEVVSTFGAFGASTKRNSDLMTGALGIGSKSGFAISSQFMVTAVKDGVRTVALFAIGDGETPESTILAEEPTTDPNGVTVRIPTSQDDARAMHAALPRTFGMWPEGSVLVDGTAPERLDVQWFGPVGFTSGLGTASMMVEMNGSLYETTEEISAMLREIGKLPGPLWKKTTIISVPLADPVDIAPSRESVRDTRRTRRVLREAVNAFIEHVSGALEEVESPIHGQELIYTLMNRHGLVDIVKAPARFADLIFRRGAIFVEGQVTYNVAELRDRVRSWGRLPAASKGMQVGRTSPVLLVFGATRATRGHLKVWINDDAAVEGIRQVILVEDESIEILGCTVSAEDPHGFSVTTAQAWKDKYHVSSCPRATKPERRYAVIAESGLVEKMTVSQMVEANPHVEIVTVEPNDSTARYRAKELKRPGCSPDPLSAYTGEGYVYLFLAPGNTVGALSKRLAQAGHQGTVTTWAKFEADLRAEFDEKITQSLWYRVHPAPALKGVLARVEELEEPARSLFRAENDRVEALRGEGMDESQAGRFERLFSSYPSIRDDTLSVSHLTMGSPVLSTHFFYSTYASRRANPEGLVDDLMAIINVRAAQQAEEAAAA